MPEEMEVGCARPTGGPVGESIDEETARDPVSPKEVKPMIQVGKKAPDFVAPAYQQGKIYGVFDEDAGVETRGRFIIDPEGCFKGMKS